MGNYWKKLFGILCIIGLPIWLLRGAIESTFEDD